MVPEWVGGTASVIPIQEAHRMIPNLIPHTAFRQMPLGYVDCEENIHYGASGHRLMAHLMMEGYRDALTNDRPGLIPPAPLSVTLTTSEAVTSLTWVAPPDSPTAPIDGWEVRWKVYDRPSTYGFYPNCVDQDSSLPQRTLLPLSTTSWTVSPQQIGRAGVRVQFQVSSVSKGQISSGSFDSWKLS